MAQNEMRAMRGMPLRVRSMEGLGLCMRCLSSLMLTKGAKCFGVGKCQ